MADSNLLSKAEQALRIVIGNGLPEGGGNVFTGKASGDKSAPCVICACESGNEEDPPFSGNFWIDAKVIVKCNAGRQHEEENDNVVEDDPKAIADLTLAGTFDIVNVTDLAAQLSAVVDGFTCFGSVPGGFESGQEEDHWVDVFNLRLLCCASDIN